MKKKHIAGLAVGGTLIGIGLARLKKPPPETPCTPGTTECRGNDLYVCSAQGKMVLEQKNSPSCIVNPTGCLQGYIVDKNTGAKIPKGQALITVDGQSFYNVVDELGGYRTPYLLNGTYHFTIEADNHETLEVDIEISQPVTSYNFELEPLPAAPGEWSDGVKVQSVSAKPAIAYPGELVYLDVYIQYDGATPATIFGAVKVDGQEIKGEFNIDFGNPTLRFEFTASQVGDYTAISQGKSAKFTVASSPVGTYYSPFGGRRTPVCTKLFIPDVGPLPGHPEGGDYIMEGRGVFLVASSLTEEQINGAHPLEWDVGTVGDRPGDDWGIFAYPHMAYATLIYVAAYAYLNCPLHWNSKEELAQAISGLRKTNQWAGYGGGFNPPELPGYDVIRGICCWEKTTFESSGFQGHVDAILHCPYCDGGIEFGNSSPIPYLDMARLLLQHIEQAHPDHPLTEPAWF